MKTIAVLIDFTEGSKNALKQAIAFAKKTNASILALHIVASSDKVKEAEINLNNFVNENKKSGIQINAEIGVGGLVEACINTFKKSIPDLIVVCTHGVKGVIQHLFGAHILKLVQGIPYPCLVINENTEFDLSSAKEILFPVGPHPNFIIKIKQTSKIAKALNASIVIYIIDRPGTDFEHHLKKNIELSENYFEQYGINFTKVIEDLNVISVGFSRQTMEYATKSNIHVLSQMASVSKNDIIFGYGDKENFLVNELGISILTCNE